MTPSNRLVPLTDALGDHSSEGIAILTAEPWRALHALIYTMIALVLTGLAWSFIGRADVIVTEQGALAPASEVRRFYAPVDGELANLYVAEGQPVAKGDVLARLNARGAVEAASNAMQAQLKLENAEREWRQFPEKKALLEQKAATLRQAMELEEQQHQKRTALGTSKLVEEQKAQMAEARTNVEETRRARDAAQLEVEKFERVFAAPGGSGVSLLQVESKRNARLAAENAYRVAQSKVDELDRPSKPGTRTGRGPARIERRAAEEAETGLRGALRTSSPLRKKNCGCNSTPRASRLTPRLASVSKTSTRTISFRSSPPSPASSPI